MFWKRQQDGKPYRLNPTLSYQCCPCESIRKFGSLSATEALTGLLYVIHYTIFIGIIKG